MPQEMTDQERSCRRHLVGRKIVMVGHMPNSEAVALNIDHRPLMLTLDDNTVIVLDHCDVRRVRQPLTVLEAMPLES